MGSEMCIRDSSGEGSQGILNTLFERLDRFVGADRQLEDDASMVVLKVPEAVSLPSVRSQPQL